MAAALATPLQTGYSFWYMRRGKSTSASKDEQTGAEQKSEGGAGSSGYESSIKTVCSVKTVQEFWECYNFLVRPNDLPTTTDYHLFREGIKPTWEDENNAGGGKWMVRLRKGLASRYWEEVILALVGGQFLGVPDGEICGAVISIRYSEDIISVWNKTADRIVAEKVRDAIKKVLQLPSHVVLEYKPHHSSLQDRSSFRNTTRWKPNGLERATSEGQPRRSSSWGERDERGKRGNRDTERSWR